MSFLTSPVSLFPIKPLRQIGEIKVDVIISESTSDVLTITKQPVQQGASISDHAYKEPTALTMQINFRDNISKSLSKIYADLLELQESRVPFNVVTPKRTYGNMLISTISNVTDKVTENILSLTLSFQEVIIVSVTTTQVPRRKQRNAGATGKTENVGKKSALVTLKEGIGALIP